MGGPGLAVPFEACEPSGSFVFVSYAHADSAVVYPELERIRSLGARVWYDEGIDPGSEWPESIGRALAAASLVVVMVSPRAMDSLNVRNEVNAAVNWRKPVVAVFLEPTVLPPGMELQLGSVQGIVRWQLDEDGYARKLALALASAGGDGPAVARGPVAEPGAGRRLVSLPPRLDVLAGREELLAELAGRLTGSDRPWPRVVALYGLGGAGKTSLAVEYAHRHAAGMGVVWQFPAEDATVLEAEFGRLAGLASASEPTGDPVADVHSLLAGSAVPWLLVFDNVPDAAAVRRFLPPAGPGQVLITSQSAIWPPGQAVEVAVLDVPVAARFLASRTGEEPGSAAKQLAAELGGLPLALEQAAAYMQASGLTMATYLRLFTQRRAELLVRGDPGSHAGTAAATLTLALTRLQDETAVAVGLLRLLACLAPEPVPLSLLLAGWEATSELDADVTAVLDALAADELAAADAVAALRRYSLVSPAGAGLLIVHRLVQAITLAQISTDLAERWRHAAAALVGAAIPADTSAPEVWPTCAVLLPHVQAVLPLASSGMERVADYLGYSGSFPAARNLFGQIVTAYQGAPDYGPEHPATLAARVRLANWTGDSGDPAAARDQLAALLPDLERKLGPEHPETLAARVKLASWTGYAEDPVAARDQLAGLLPVVQRILGPEHPDALQAAIEHARWTAHAGDWAGARDQLVALVPVLSRVLGPEHPVTLGARAALASHTGTAGDLAAARDMQRALLPIVERVFGAEHPDALVTRANLAAVTGLAGDPAEARDQYAVLAPLTERVSGPEHPDTLSARNGLALWTGEAGDPAAARDQLEALLAIHERLHGAEHPDTLYTRSYLGRYAGQAGDPAAARDQFAALLPAMERVLGAEHPATLTARAYHARWTGEVGDPVGARDQLAALLPVREGALGPEHPDALTTRSGLARWTGEAGDPAAARDQLAALLPVMERVLGPEHPDTSVARAGLAHWGEVANLRIAGPSRPPSDARPVRDPGCPGAAGLPARRVEDRRCPRIRRHHCIAGSSPAPGGTP